MNFLEQVDQTLDQLPDVSWDNLVDSNSLIVSVDMINGFVHKGTLASPLVKAIVPAVVDVFENAIHRNLTPEQNFLFIQDSHSEDSLEFNSFPPHCIVGTDEAKTIPELERYLGNTKWTWGKNSLGIAELLIRWYDIRPCPINLHELSTVIIVGNCTDLCVYQAAMGFKMEANEFGHDTRILVPRNAVATFDGPQHPADVFGNLFLYHMIMNGIEVCRGIVD